MKDVLTPLQLDQAKLSKEAKDSINAIVEYINEWLENSYSSEITTYVIDVPDELDGFFEQPYLAEIYIPLKAILERGRFWKFSLTKDEEYHTHIIYLERKTW